LIGPSDLLPGDTEDLAHSILALAGPVQESAKRSDIFSTKFLDSFCNHNETEMSKPVLLTAAALDVEN
jgi:hypothetical protein